MSSLVECFCGHSLKGDVVPAMTADEFLGWKHHVTGEPYRLLVNGPIISYSWKVGEERLELDNRNRQTDLRVLPDASGLIAFATKMVKYDDGRDGCEFVREPNNTLLFDPYGRERLRLVVPWHLTREKNPESAKPPTSFEGTSGSYPHPETGVMGKYGLKAWVQYSGLYHFEFDYHTGEFLWGREIRD